MIDLQIVSEFVYENFENITTEKNNEQFIARCSLCGDSDKSKRKRRFYLYYNNGNPIYHCFNCGDSGTFLKLYSLIKSITINESKRILFGYDTKKLVKRTNLSYRDIKPVKKKVNNESNIFNDIIKNECLSLDDEDDGSIQKNQLRISLQNFINERKIPDNKKVFIAYKGKYMGRIIIPIYDNDNIVYFQARSIYDTDKPKYKNPPFDKSLIILNKNIFKKDKYIIITEGIIDAFSVGDQGTTCFGRTVDKSFIKEISKYTDIGIIIAFDNDESGRESLNNILNMNFNTNIPIKYFIFPKENKDIKDINNYGVLHNSGVYNFIVSNSYDKLKTRVEMMRKYNENN